MTNEQREAVEICKEKIIEPFYNFPNPISIELKDTDVGAIETILSLIKEQQGEIEGLKNKEVLIKRYFKKCDLIKQKDKQIQELEKEKIELKEYNKIVSDRIVEYKKNSISTQAVIDLIENETIDISGFECIAVEDLQELLEGERK